MPHSLSYPSLGLFRIVVGLYAAGEIALRFLGNFGSFFSPQNGILGRCFSEQYIAHYGHPFNPLYYASNDYQLIFYLLLALVLAIALVLGWYGRFAALGLAVMMGFWFHRFPSLYIGFEQYGIAMLTLAALLPVDRALGLMADENANNAEAKFHSPLSTFALIQVGAIYFFNAIFKYGYKWLNGTAVAFASADPDRASFLAPLVASSGFLSGVLTYITLLAEFALIFFLLLPSRKSWPRYAAVASILLLHWGIALVIDVGNFKWIALSAAALILPSSFWSGVALGQRRLLNWKPSLPASRVLPESLPASGLLAVVLTYALLSSQLDQWLSSPMEDPVREQVAQSGLGKMAMNLPRLEIPYSVFNQYWHLFAPNPPQERGYLEVQLTDQRGQTVPRFNGSAKKPGEYSSRLEQQFCSVVMVKMGRNQYDKIAQRCFLEREIALNELPGMVQADLVIMSFRPQTLDQLKGEPNLERYVLEGRKLP